MSKIEIKEIVKITAGRRHAWVRCYCGNDILVLRKPLTAIKTDILNRFLGILTEFADSEDLPEKEPVSIRRISLWQRIKNFFKRVLSI